MFNCRKCKTELSAGSAQQSADDIEAAVLAFESATTARQKTLSFAPRCDDCCRKWIERYREKRIAKQVAKPDTRSPAIRRLDEACARLAVEGV